MDTVHTTCLKCKAGNVVTGPYNVSCGGDSNDRRAVFKGYNCHTCGHAQVVARLLTKAE